MAIVHIATTRGRDLQPLGTAGQSAAESWSALVTLLAQRLGDAHARVIAEPVTNAAQGETDWYADSAEPVRRLATLPPPEQEAARHRLETLVGGITGLAAAMQAGRTDSDRFLGAMLELTVQVPDESFIYVAGDQPILVAWGHAKAGPAVERVTLGGARRVASRPMVILPPPAPPVAASRNWLPPLAAALLAAALLLGGAGYVVARDPLHWYAVGEPPCQPPSGDIALRDSLAEAAQKEADLRLRLAQLTTDAGGRRLQCPPTVVAAAPPPPPPPAPPPNTDERRAEQRGAQRGKLRIILAWDDRNDLDLHVFCPSGGHIFFNQRNTCGGHLDIDANGDSRRADASPVENVYFDQLAPGHYRIVVDPYELRVARSSNYRVTIQQEGKPDRVITGTANLGQRLQEVAAVDIES